MGFKVKNQEHHSIQLLGKSVEEVIEIIEDYQETVHNYGWAVTLVRYARGLFGADYHQYSHQPIDLSQS